MDKKNYFIKVIIFGTIVGILYAFLICSSISERRKIAITEEIRKTLDKNDVQVIIALGNNYDAKKSLLLSSKLNSDGLIALCLNPKPLKIKDSTIQEAFEKAIKKVELTEKQQIQIAQIGETVYSKALLLSPNLTPEGLIAICENPGKLNLKDDATLELFKNAIKNTELTDEQRIKIAKSKVEGIGLF